MKLFAPKYYKDFKCIADKCNHSCCIGWEIDVDSAALKKYQKLSHSYGKDIIDSIDHNETPHFKLSCGERCPHLNDAGLCKIILNVGEEYLCDICREHPRFYNDALTHKEVGLGMACEEACRIILNSSQYDNLIEIRDIDGKIENPCFDTVVERTRIYSILSNKSIAYREKLSCIYDIYGISPSYISDDIWTDLISNLEYLNEAHKEMFLSYSSDLTDTEKYDKILERALAYYIFRHCTEAEDESEFKISLGFCLFCERLLATVLKFKNAKLMEEIIPLAVAVSEEIEYSEDNTEAIKFEYTFI